MEDTQRWRDVENLNVTTACIPAGEPYVSGIEASHFDTLTFDVAIRIIGRTTGARTCTRRTMAERHSGTSTNNLPADGPADYVHVVREDPRNRDLLFVGTSIRRVRIG